MNELGIPCRLEAFYPIVEIGMDIWDFNRCLGILLDNAIEAAQESGQPGVELLLMSQGGFLTVRVANPWEGEIDITRIWEEGYSTKGGERGLGFRAAERFWRSIREPCWLQAVKTRHCAGAYPVNAVSRGSGYKFTPR